jgi:hypothetical protein
LYSANRKQARSLYKKKKEEKNTFYTLEQLKNTVKGKEKTKRNKTARSMSQAVR